MNIPVYPDLHMHSTVSDGTDSPEEILNLVKKKGFDCFSLTDHDDCSGCREIRKVLDDSIRFINGIEFSCTDEKGKYHILGYGFQLESKVLNDVIKKGHGFRVYKFLERVNFLHDELGIILPEERIDQLMLLNNPGSPHIGQLMVEFGYAKSIDDAIKNYIKKKKFKSYYLKPHEAIEGILAAGGIPVLAHPVFGNGSQNIRGEELEERVIRLREMGLKGLEGFYSKYDDSMREEVQGLAAKYQMYVTVGSDYHGTIKTVSLGDTGFDSGKEIPEGMRRFFADIGDGSGRRPQKHLFQKVFK